MTRAFVVRHADAGDRHTWDGDDALRPLTAKGRRQAEWIAHELAPEPLGWIGSSPYVRCRETVGPLSRLRHLDVESRAELAEGAGPDPLLGLVTGSSEDIVLCTHGDVLQELLAALIASGIISRHHAQGAKGSIWTLEHERGALRRATYREPPAPA